MPATSITVRVTLTIRRRGGRTLVMAPDASVVPGMSRQATTPSDPALVKALARPFRYQRTPEQGCGTGNDGDMGVQRRRHHFLTWVVG